MNFVLKPWQLWVVTLAGWINQQQEQVRWSGEIRWLDFKAFAAEGARVHMLISWFGPRE